jgi:hypothetical protein
MEVEEVKEVEEVQDKEQPPEMYRGRIASRL